MRAGVTPAQVTKFPLETYPVRPRERDVATLNDGNCLIQRLSEKQTLHTNLQDEATTRRLMRMQGFPEVGTLQTAGTQR